jgi:hypothetical protein
MTFFSPNCMKKQRQIVLTLKRQKHWTYQQIWFQFSPEQARTCELCKHGSTERKNSYGYLTLNTLNFFAFLSENQNFAIQHIIKLLIIIFSNFNAGPPHFLMRIRILLLIDAIWIYDHCSTEPPWLHFEPPRLHCECPRHSRLHFGASKAPKLLL